MGISDCYLFENSPTSNNSDSDKHDISNSSVNNKIDHNIKTHYHKFFFFKQISTLYIVFLL